MTGFEQLRLSSSTATPSDAVVRQVPHRLVGLVEAIPRRGHLHADGGRSSQDLPSVVAGVGRHAAQHTRVWASHGDDATAKQTMMRLVEELGFDVVDVGGLDESWRQQPGDPCQLADLDAERLRVALADASPERPALFRA